MLSVSFSDACNENNDNVSGVNSTVTSSSQHSIADIFSGLSSKRVYYCQRCLNHGVLAPRKNHKCQCIHAQCNCAKCILVERRRVLNTQLHELEESEQQQQQFQVDVGEEETDASNSTSDSLANSGDCQPQSQHQPPDSSPQLSSKGDESHTAAMMLMLTSSMAERNPKSLQDQQQALRRAIGLESLHALLLQAAGTGFDSTEEDSNNNKSGGRCSIRPSTTTIDEAEMDDDAENGQNNNFSSITDSVNTTSAAGSNYMTKILVNTNLERTINNSGTNVNRCSFSSSSTSSAGGRSGSTSSFCDGAAADDLKVFRSRISTSNSIRSNATTNSSFSSSGYSGSSTAPSPAMLLHDFYGGVLETAGNFVANDDNTCDDGTISAFRRVSGSSVANIRIKGERVPNCQKCGQHGRKSRLKGHKRFCPFKNCECAKCQVITERQKLMADQIKIRRRQCKDTLLRMKREKLSSSFVATGGRSSDTFDNSCATTDGVTCGSSNFVSAAPEVQCSPSPILPLRIAPSSFTSTSPSLATYLTTLNLLCKQLALVPSSLQPQVNSKANFKEATLANTGNNFGTLNLKNQELSILNHVCSPRTLPLLNEDCSDEKSPGENTDAQLSPLPPVTYPTSNGTQRTSFGDGESTLSHFGTDEMTNGISAIFPVISQSVIKTPTCETISDTQHCAVTEKILNHLNTATSAATSTSSNGGNVTNSLLIKSLLLGQQNNNDTSIPTSCDATFYQQQQFLRLLGAVSVNPVPPHSATISPLNALDVQQNVIPMVLQASHSAQDVHHPSPSIFPSISLRPQYLSSLSTQSSAINAIISSSPNIQLFNRSVTSASSTSTTAVNVAENSPMLSKLLTSIATPPINVTDYQMTTSSTPVEQNMADSLQ